MIVYYCLLLFKVCARQAANPLIYKYLSPFEGQKLLFMKAPKLKQRIVSR